MTVPENPIGGMECDLNGFQSIRYVNGDVDILYSYVSFAVQYTHRERSFLYGILKFLQNQCSDMLFFANSKVCDTSTTLLHCMVAKRSLTNRANIGVCERVV